MQDGLSTRAKKLGITGAGAKQATAEAIVEAEGLPFTNRFGAAVNFERLGEDDSEGSQVSLLAVYATPAV